MTAPIPGLPTFHEEGIYFPSSTSTALLVEDVYQFQSVPAAHEASVWIAQVVSRCGLPSMDSHGNVIGRLSPASEAPTLESHCKDSQTYGPVSDYGSTWYGDGAVCGNTMTALQLSQAAPEVYGLADLSAYLSAATHRRPWCTVRKPRTPPGSSSHHRCTTGRALDGGRPRLLLEGGSLHCRWRHSV